MRRIYGTLFVIQVSTLALGVAALFAACSAGAYSTALDTQWHELRQRRQPYEHTRLAKAKWAKYAQIAEGGASVLFAVALGTAVARRIRARRANYNERA